MNTILYKVGSEETINNIVECMSNTLNKVRYSARRDRMLDKPEISNNVIRWGCVGGTIQTRRGLNKASAIRLTSNKGKCRKFLHDNGIAVPTPVDLHRLHRRDFPLVVRPEFHQKGQNFLLFNNGNELRASRGEIERLHNPYVSRYYPKQSEWRVHVAHGRVLLVQEKVGPDTRQHSWNHENGFNFEVVNWDDYREDIVRLAVDALELTELDFGAVDILADPRGWFTDLPSAVVCEINTAPKLEGYTAQRYAEYFDWFIRTKEKRHFIIPENAEAEDYAFRHEELSDDDYLFNFKR